MPIKQKIAKNFSLTLILAVLLASCDPGLINNFVIDNSSEYEVITNFKIKENQRRLDSSDSIQTRRIKSGSKIEIVDYGEIGNAHDKKELFLEAFETITVTINGINITEKVIERKRWKYKIINEGLNSLDEVEYKLVIQNEDIIKVKR